MNNLANGIHIPCIGTGPGALRAASRWHWADHIPILGKVVNAFVRRISNLLNQRKWVNCLAESLKMGYRLIDYSSAYGNEQLLHKAIAKSGLKREDVFIVSRASNNDQYNHCVRESFMESLKKIGVDYVDLLQFHWPVTDFFPRSSKQQALESKKKLKLMEQNGYIIRAGHKMG